jgi:RNA polymerase sigma factor (sigma-70 family)
MEDQEQLRDFVHTGSQSAFRVLVDRHLGLVYSAALRMARDSQLAERITHGVFATLASKAESLNPADVLARWLHDTTRRLAAHALLTANQRSGGDSAARSAAAPGPEAGAGRVIDDLEAMMDKLPPADRDAIVLRFLENRRLPDVAAALRLDEAAAHARVTHAVERLHRVFNEQGVPISSAVLAAVLASECAAHVPIGLSLAVSSDALAAAATVPPPPAAKDWWNQRTAASVFIAGLLALTGIIVLQAARVRQLRSENERLLAERKKLKAEYAMGRPLAAPEGRFELVRLRRSEEELLRLRREVAQLRKEGDATVPAATPVDPPPPALTPAGPHEPGTFITGADLRFVGYSTPQAAMETTVWSTVVGNYDAFLTALSPEDRAEELAHPEGREFFEVRQQQLAPLFRGLQVSALKVLTDDEVEIKVLLDFGSQVLQIQPLVKINDQWRLATSMRDYDSDWDSDGEVLQFSTVR